MDLTTLIIVALFCFVAGFVDAVAGGGGLVSLPGYYIAGFQAHEAIGTNKINSLLASFTAMISYARRGFVPWRLAIPCALVGLVGSCGGALLALSIPSAVFTAIMVVLIPLTAIYLFRSKAFSSQESASQSTSHPASVGDPKAPCSACDSLSISAAPSAKVFDTSMVKVLIISLIIGAYDGFYGPGSGTFLLVLYTGFAGLSLNVANGVSKVVICATNLAGMIVFSMGGQALLMVGLVAGVTSIVGSALGARAFSRGGIKLAKPLILVVLAIFFVRIIGELFSL